MRSSIISGGTETGAGVFSRHEIGLWSWLCKLAFCGLANQGSDSNLGAVCSLGIASATVGRGSWDSKNAHSGGAVRSLLFAVSVLFLGLMRVVSGSKCQVPGRSRNCFMAHFALLGNTWLLLLLCIAKQSEQGDIGVQAGQ